MIKKSLLVVICFWLTTQHVMADGKKSLLILGDSLSAAYGMTQEQGWVHLLNQRAENFSAEKEAPYHIINASISGEVTAGGLARLPKILATNTFDYLIIELGGNDGLRGFPPQTIKNNLLHIIKLAKEKNINIALMEIKIPPNYGAKYNQLFTDVFKQVAEETEVHLLTFFMEEIAIKPELMQKDGIHPNVAAQNIIANNMAKQIELLIQSE